MVAKKKLIPSGSNASLVNASCCSKISGVTMRLVVTFVVKTVKWMGTWIVLGIQSGRGTYFGGFSRNGISMRLELGAAH